MQLFDLVRVMFTDPKKYREVKNSDKAKNQFMINRFMSIKYPSNAQLFNVNGISGANVVDSWSMVASRFKSVPGWFYTKTKKAKKNVPDKYNPSERALQIYMDKNQIGAREIAELKQFAKESFYTDLKKIEEQIDVYAKS